MTSLDTYGLGSLFMIDAVHIPFGCSVWPSFWTFGMESTWPGSGEIDIIEAINGMDNNQIALHTLPGCTQGQAPQSGTTTETDCSPKRGCTVTENKPNSFGPGFATAGGGVFALQMEASGMNLWFWGVCGIIPWARCLVNSSHYVCIFRDQIYLQIFWLPRRQHQWIPRTGEYLQLHIPQILVI